MNQTDFIAELTFLPTEKSGRNNLVHTGYCLHIEFENYSEYLTSGHQTYIGQEFVELGTTVHAKIAILDTVYFANRLYEDMKFKFFEGRHMIGYGKITEIVNPDVRREPTSDQQKINLNLYPIDIIKRLQKDYASNLGEAMRSIQELLISHKDFQSHRIVRALVFTGNKDIVQLKKMIALARIDWRDLLLCAEYETADTRVRNFTKEFGKEEIKPKG
ncbi:elongation factor Tu [Kordia sp.]|uniref:elongation factor Tu n=1 Tax=Kordia sp. TaxID=1965332 RepID=UPI003D2CC8C4